MSEGKETIAGLGARKRQLYQAGGTDRDVAVAMLETLHMSTADYLLGDVDGIGRPKTGDAANFGIFKQNWMMIRQTVPQFMGLGPGDWTRGGALNMDLRLDVDTLHESQLRYGLAGPWWAGHRNGATGLAKPETSDIVNYRHAVENIQRRIIANPAYRTDNTRLWVYVPPI
jgi:hypothetical protein